MGLFFYPADYFEKRRLLHYETASFVCIASNNPYSQNEALKKDGVFFIAGFNEER